MKIRYGITEEQVKNGWTIWNDASERKAVREIGKFLQMPYSQRKENISELEDLACKLDSGTFKEVLEAAMNPNYRFVPNQLREETNKSIYYLN